MRNLLTLLFFLMFASLGIRAQALEAHMDSTHLVLRSFSKDALNKYSQDEEFQYSEKGRDLTPSLWQRFWRWFWSLFKFNKFSVGNATFWKWAVIVIASAIVLYAVLKLRGMDPFLLFNGKSRSVDLPFEEVLEDIRQISFDEEIRAALDRGNYKLAIRLLYLKSLRRLDETGRIQWEPGKTNWTYVGELKHQAQRRHFQSLTTQFEYAWYGDFPIDRQIFDRISHSFNDFNKGVFR